MRQKKRSCCHFSSFSLKYQATRTMCFSVVQSVDSSAMTEKVFLFISCTCSSLRAGETTFLIILVHFVLCKLSFFQVTLTAACSPPLPPPPPNFSNMIDSRNSRMACHTYCQTYFSPFNFFGNCWYFHCEHWLG